MLIKSRDCRPYPEEKELYKQRSPINSLDTWKAPTAFFQVIQGTLISLQPSADMASIIQCHAASIARMCQASFAYTVMWAVNLHAAYSQSWPHACSQLLSLKDECAGAGR